MTKAVMTIHGFLTNAKDFGRLYDHLDFYDEIKAVEAPGHGGEKPDFSQFVVDGTFKTVLKAYDELRAKHDQVDVVGYSMGGALTTWLCSVRDVHRAVLIAPANKYVNWRMPFDASLFYTTFMLNTYRNQSGKISEKLDATNEAYAPYKENIATSAKLLFDRAIVGFNAYTYSVFRKLIKKCNTVVETMSPLPTPALVMWGKLDELVPYNSIKFVVKHFANIKEIVYPDISHAMLYTNRDTVLIREIVDFLSK